MRHAVNRTTSICWLRNNHTCKYAGGLHRKNLNQEQGGENLG